MGAAEEESNAARVDLEVGKEEEVGMEEDEEDENDEDVDEDKEINFPEEREFLAPTSILDLMILRLCAREGVSKEEGGSGGTVGEKGREGEEEKEEKDPGRLEGGFTTKDPSSSPSSSSSV